MGPLARLPRIKQALVGKAAQAQLVLGLAVLLLGTVVYLVDRPPAQAFFPGVFNFCEVTPCVFGRLGQSLPSFAHAFAFTLLTAVLLGGGKRTTFAVCLGWTAMETAFELGQHPALAPGLVKLIPSWFAQIPVLGKADRYFLHGTFDPVDILFIALGALAAYVVTQKTQRREVRHVARHAALVSLVAVGVLSILATSGGGGDESIPPPKSLPPTVTLSLTQFATGLTAPVGVYNAGAGDDRLFVIEQAGRIRIVQSNGTVLATPFLDISGRVSSGGERGLLGLAFHPNYAAPSNGFFYVNYTSTTGGRTHISRFRVMPGNPNVADPGSEVILLTVTQPASNHNAGDLHFGPAPGGFLYIPLGDGGAGGGPAQNFAVLLGKVLRIDVNGSVGSPADCLGAGTPGEYTIPAGNPFVDGPGGDCDEIWALGLRNPWRSSFDRVTGDFYIGDVGEGDWEEIDFQPAGSGGGANYGWPCFEGNASFDPGSCPSGPITFPIFAYSHSGGECSVIGGYVYRGNLFPALVGRYFLTDLCTGNFWDIIPDGAGGWQVGQHTNLARFGFVSFGEDANGEIYVVHQGSGTLYRLGGM